MSEFGDELLAEAEKLFASKLKNSKKIKSLAKSVRKGSSSYDIANDYAVEAGRLLSESLTEALGDVAYVSEEVARELLAPMLGYDHDVVTTITEAIQKNMNTENGLGIGVKIPQLDTNRIDGFISKLSSYQKFEDGKWVLQEPVINFSQAIVDQSIRDNASATSKLGLPAKIVRKAESHGFRTVRRGGKSYSYRVPCKWCSGLSGTYDYSEVKNTGNDVFRRHENCRCQITYVNGTERRDVASKVSWTGDDAKAKAQAIAKRQEQLEIEERIKAQNRASRRENIERLMRETGYSAKGASILVNVYKNQIKEFGIEYVIDLTLSGR